MAFLPWLQSKPLFQLDVKNAFQQHKGRGDPQELVSIQPPPTPGFSSPRNLGMQAQESDLRYGLRQAKAGPLLSSWCLLSEIFLLSHCFIFDKGFHCSRADSPMFVCRRHGRSLILLLYVDDNILTGNDSSLLFYFIKELDNLFVSFIRCITFSAWRYLAPPLDFA